MSCTLHTVVIKVVSFPHNCSAPKAFTDAVREGRATRPASYRKGQQWSFQDSWPEIYINLTWLASHKAFFYTFNPNK